MAPLAPRHPDRVARGGGPGRATASSAPAAFGGKLPGGRRAADPRRQHQPRARRRARGLPAGDRVRRGRRAQGRGVRRDPRPGPALRRRPGLRHPARRADDPRASASAPRCPGLLPIPEIQYLAYLHNAEDQLRGEAASLQFFSDGQYRNPMVVRVAGPGLPEGLRRALPQRQRGRRAARHPGPRRRRARTRRRRRRDAAHLPRRRRRRRHGRRSSSSRSRSTTRATCTSRATAAGCRRTAGPTDWAGRARPDRSRPHLRRRRRPHHRDASATAYRCRCGSPAGSPTPASARGCSTCAGSRRCRSRTSSARPRATGRVLVVDETRASGGVSEGVITALVDAGYAGQVARVAAADSFIPLGDAANHVLVSEAAIEKAAQELLGSLLDRRNGCTRCQDAAVSERGPIRP